MDVLGIIPARGGSKGIPGKNMLLIGNKPLIGHSIQTAVESNSLSNIVVTSDDQSILNYASAFGVTTHLRPAILATDTSPIVETIIEVLKFTEKANKKAYDSIMILQPTSPLRETWHLHEALALLETYRDSNSVISVSSINHPHPARMYEIKKDYLSPLLPEFEELNRQQLPPLYIRNGSIYIVRRNELLKQKKIMIKPAVAYLMDNKYFLNIDEPKDLLLARTIFDSI